MDSTEESKVRLPRKLTKKRKPLAQSSMQYPDRLGLGEDVQEDVTAPKGKAPLNQSIFSMVAAAGSRTNFHSRFGEDDSSSDDDGTAIIPGRQGTASPTEVNAPRNLKSHIMPAGSKDRKISLKSLPKLKLRTAREKRYMSQSTILPSRRDPELAEYHVAATPRDAPVMTRMLEAQARAEAQIQGTVVGESSEESSVLSSQPISTIPEHGPTNLALKLMDIFGFEAPEHVISEYPCWLLQSVLLQGYMYITEFHICFFAYLPKKSNVIAKSGYLSKRGKQNPKYNRYWFTLKGDVLSYYTDPSDLYFPSGNIDLRYGISANLAESKDKSKDALAFNVTTDHRTYHFKADSASSAKEWVKTLQKVIFRSHNDGDSVKISLPVGNIIDVEESPVIEFADTFKIRVFDSDETYAMDEYFFSFFSFGKDAFDVLTALVDDTPARRVSVDLLSPLLTPSERRSSPHARHDSPRSARALSPNNAKSPVFQDSVRATFPANLPPVVGRVSPRVSGDWSRQSMELNRNSLDLSQELKRGSFDVRGRRSASAGRSSFVARRRGQESPSSKPQGSSDSYVHSMEPGTESILNPSSSGTQGSASQMLNRDDLFQSPTIGRLPSAPRRAMSERSDRKGSSAKDSSDSIRVHPPSRSQTIGRVTTKPKHSRAQTDNLVLPPDDEEQRSSSGPSLQQLVKAGAYPLQRAAGFADFLRRNSKRVSSLLASESMGYVEKVSGMWQGGQRHYSEAEAIKSVNKPEFGDDDEEEAKEGHGDRFRAHFALLPTEKLQATYFGYLHRVLPLYGKLYISSRKLCFRSLLPGSRTKLILPFKDIENVDKEKGFRFGYSGMVVVVRGCEEIFFEFGQSEVRDDCTVTLLQGMESLKYLQASGILSHDDLESAEAAKAEHRMLQEARMDGYGELELKPTGHLNDVPPILFDDPRASIINFKPLESLRITCLTIGSRGDVQPYIALCKGLLAEGHTVRIATHAEFEPWVRQHGIDFAPVDGDPAELMRICVENGMFTYSFLKEASVKFRGWIDDLLSSAWTACQETDLLIESPSAMAGIHIAEALAIPYFRAFTMPWTRTRAYPHAFAVPEHKMGGAYNYLTYVMFDNVFWTAIAGQVNRWRKKELGLRGTNLDKLHPNKVPFLYNFSPSVVAPPLDYSDWIRVTGYWFLDEAISWTPPPDLVAFIAKARIDGKKIVYVGFGSIVVADPVALTKTIVDSVLKADVRCILSKGWSDRLGSKDATVSELPLPASIHQIKSAPHDWLFQQIDAVAHHGGAGTTGASLRAGKPTIIKPFFGDQFFFGSRVEDLGVGICLKKLNVSVLSRAFWEATHSERMIIKAKVLGEQIQNENGVATAIQAIYRDLDYAKSLIKNRSTHPDAELPDEESWTFIGDESDPELARRIAEWEPMNRTSAEVKKSGGSTGTVTPPVGGRGLALKFRNRKSREPSGERVS